MNDWRRSFYAILAAQWIAMVGFNFVMPFTPLYIQELGITDLKEIEWWSGILSASTGAMLTLTSPIWGAIGDRAGRKLMLQRCLFAGALLLFAMGFARTVQDLLVLRLLHGSIAGTIAASMTLAATVSPRHLMGRNLGLMQTAVYAGSSLGPFLGGMVAELFGFRAVFGMTGGIALVAGLLVTFLVKEQFTPQKGSKLDVGDFARNMWLVIRSPALLHINLVFFCLQAATFSISPILALFIQEINPQGGNVIATAGLVFGATAVASAVSAAFVGQHSDRWGYQRVLLCSVVGAGLLALPQAFVTTTWQLLALRVLQGMFIGGALPTANAIIGHVTPTESRGSAFGITFSATSLGQALGPLSGAAVAAGLGLRATFIYGCALFFLAAFGASRVKFRAMRQSTGTAG